MPASSDLVQAPRTAASIPSVIYFVGDSITLGWGDEELGGWPARLLRRLHADGYGVTGYNLGIRGDTSSKIADRWEDEVRRRRRDGNALTVFAFGVNDAIIGADGRQLLPPEKTVSNVRQILGRAVHQRILMIGPAPIDEDLMHKRLNAGGGAAMPTPASIARIAQSMKAEARHAGVPFLDLLAAFETDPNWLAALAQTDGLHPSSAGHDLIAAEIGRWEPWRQVFPNANE